jgi:branched-chain amino acid transport system permease protein
MFSLAILGQVIVNGISLSAIYILVSLGFTLLFGIMRVVNFAHGSLAMLGGYALFYLYGQYHFPYVLAAPLAAFLVAFLALGLERLVYRFFYQKMFQSMIGLLGLDMVLTYSAVLIWGPHERSVPVPVSDVYRLGPLFLSGSKLVIIGVAALTLLAFYLFTHFTKYGLAMRAAAQDVETAEVQGINTDRIYMMAFFIAIFMTALAGGFFAQNYALSPFLGERPLMMAFIAVILGGMGSIPGVAVGGLVLGMAESFLGTYFGSTTSIFVTFGAVIVLLIVRPWGLLGTPETR